MPVSNEEVQEHMRNFTLKSPEQIENDALGYIFRCLVELSRSEEWQHYKEATGWIG